MPDLAGTVVADRYTLERELGRGGMATVWLARDQAHDRSVAIKVLHPELAGAIGVDRFIREVRLTARFQHPNIVPILDSGVLRTPDGTSLPWYAMTRLDGESLRARLTGERQLPVGEALDIAEAVGNALTAAHAQGVVHRDIKPENVFLSGGHVYVVDFGIAKALIETGTERLTSTGLAVGTPAYMSPEQATADRIDPRTDQYSLAAVLYEMLAGEPPFTGPTAQAVVARRLTEPARPIQPVRSTVPEPVERAVLRALERAPADRFPDVRAFTTALRSAASPAVSRSRRPDFRRAALLAGLLVAVAGGGWLLSARARGLPSRGAPDPGVAALYQRGRQAYERRTPAGAAEAVAAFSAAIARDSAFAPAWTGLARTYERSYRRAFAIGSLAADSLLQRALAAADRALAIDPGSSEAWLARALVTRSVDPTELEPALRAIRRAIALDSGNAHGWLWYAVLLADSGDLAGGMAGWRRCVSLDPAYTECLAFLGIGHYWQRRYDSAAAWADSAIAVDPNYLLGRQVAANIAVERGDFPRAAAGFDAARRVSTDVEVVNSLAGSALAEARAGRGREARTILRRADSMAAVYVPAPLHTAAYLAQAYAALGEIDRALAWLTRYEPRRDLHYQLHLRCDPPFEPLRGDERFRSLLVPMPGRGC